MWKDLDIICHSACNIDLQLSVDLYMGGVILSPGTGTAWKENNMSNDQEVTQPKPNPVLEITDTTKLKISLKSGYAPLSFK